MQVYTLQLGELRANCHIAVTAKGQCVAVDIGGDGRVLIEFLKMKGLKLSKILLTHGHFDHMCGVEEVRLATGAEVYIHEDDAPMLTSERKSLSTSLSFRGFNPVTQYITVKDNCYIKDGDYEFRVIHTPGHSYGSVCYIADDAMFSGDTIFCCSIGRTDFEGSNPHFMNESLKKIYALEGDYTIYTGHDQKTTLAYEKKNNPYLKKNGIQR